MQPSDVVSVLGAVAWPLSALIIALILRGPLGQMLANIGARATKLSVLQVSIELAAVPEAPSQWSVDVGSRTEDLRQLTPAQTLDSYAMTLFEQLNNPTAFDYAVVDLEEGKAWLTSRLFLFAVLLERMRNLRSFVFVHREGGLTRRFLGIASPRQVRWALAMQYPWLEAAWAQAYASSRSALGHSVQQLNDGVIRSHHGALDIHTARTMGQVFLELIQRSQPPDPADEHRWVSFDQPPPESMVWERGSWINATTVERDLGEALDVSAAVRDVADWSPEQRVHAVLAKRSPFVALVDQEGRFHPRIQSLVARDALFDALQIV